MFILLLLFIIIASIIIFSFIMNFLFINKKDRQKILEIFNLKKTINCYSINQDLKKNFSLSFVPHPFTNFSLNPNYKNTYGDMVHTAEGFRKTCEDKSIFISLEKKIDYNIVCIGGSSTQCENMEKFEDTWPAILKKSLSKNINVFNFGVGAWTTLHSYIRCINWLPIIKPDLVIFYQAKNDLTPYKNGNLKEKFIYSDYQNIMSQYSDTLQINFPRWFRFIPFFLIFFYFFVYKKKFQALGILNIYKPYPEISLNGLKRFNKEALNSTIFRNELFFDLFKKIKCNVLYIPEIVHGGDYEMILEKTIYPEINKISKKYKNIKWFDLKQSIPFNNEHFVDKMHFSKKGNLVFGTLLSKFIEKNYLK